MAKSGDEKVVNLLFVIPTLEIGGAERVCLHYLNNLRTYGRALALVLGQGPLIKEVASDVPVLELFDGDQRRCKATSFYPYLLVRQARKLAKAAEQSQCEIIISFLTLANIIAILAKIFFCRYLKVIINVHDVTGQILKHTKLKRYQRVLVRWLVRFLYPQADLIVAVAQGIKQNLVENFGIPAEKIKVIYNPIDVGGIRVRATEPLEHPWYKSRSGSLIIGVGRLVATKGFDLLIRAMRQLPPETRLVIIGDGREQLELQRLISELGLTDRVMLMGFQENPWKYMARADLFVLSSLTEGLPNVLGEALALGLPLLATDCSPGIREYLQDGQYGLLVPPGDVNALAQGLERLLTDSELRQRLVQNAYKQVEAFDLPHAIQAYEAALACVIRDYRHRKGTGKS